MRRTTITKAAAALLTALTLLSAAPTALAAWEGDSGLKWLSASQKTAWAWIRVSGSTQGKAYARVGNAESDTGWFKGGKRQAKATGPAVSFNVRHDYYVK